MPCDIAVSHVMEEGLSNGTVGNETLVNATSSPGTTVSADGRHGCALYDLIMYGVVQLVITVVGLVGKSVHSRIN